ncbi:hypothetical protein [Salinithrix halophila]|uniref:Uncharacterized protein n=1 Tax=Salinithrix halophila TaxID=1485204 RepID=A0ABV8JEQ1_9BACL
MAYSGGDYDVIVISTDPAGSQAAKEAARSGKTALLLQLNPGSVASVMCSTPVHGSIDPKQPVEGVDAYLIHPGDPGDDEWSEVRTTQQETDSHHSVYILQSLLTQSEHAAEDPGDSSVTEVEKGVAPEESEESEEEYPYTRTVWNNEGLQEEEREPFTAADIRRERDLKARRRLLHRPVPPSPTSEKRLETEQEEDQMEAPQPVLRERDIDLRRRLNGAYRRPVDNFRPKQEERQPSPPPEEKDSFLSSSFTNNQPFFQGKEEEEAVQEEPFQGERHGGDHTDRGYSSSVIPMNQGRLKSKRQGRPKETSSPKEASSQPVNNKLEPFSQKQRQSAKQTEEEIPGPMVWEAKRPRSKTEKPAPPKKEETAEERAPFSGMTYEPFSRNRRSGESQQTERKEATSKGPLSYQPPTSGKNDGIRLRSHESISEKGPFSQRQKKQITPREPAKETPPQRQPVRQNEESQRDNRSFMREEAARNILQNTSDHQGGLKRDNIDIEDPYGQSYEDFLEPFAHNNPQTEQLERRKLALRGLHNLINNLG